MNQINDIALQMFAADCAAWENDDSISYATALRSAARECDWHDRAIREIAGDTETDLDAVRDAYCALAAEEVMS